VKYKKGKKKRKKKQDKYKNTIGTRKQKSKKLQNWRICSRQRWKIWSEKSLERGSEERRLDWEQWCV